MSCSLERRTERLAENGVGEWLEQTLHRSLFEKGLTQMKSVAETPQK